MRDTLESRANLLHDASRRCRGMVDRAENSVGGNNRVAVGGAPPNIEEVGWFAGLPRFTGVEWEYEWLQRIS